MQKDEECKGIMGFYNAVLEIEKKVIQNQKQLLGLVADVMAKTILNEKRIFIFGTGHSHMMMEEAFYRAGGIPAAVPIFVTSLMLHEHVGLSGRMERTPGLAAPILDQYLPEEDEMIIIYSNSGVNQLPVEMAIEAKARKMIVVAVCAKEYAKIAPLSSLEKRLYEVADYSIDNFGIPGDAIVEIEGFPWRVGSTSTISGSLIWNCLLSEAVLRLSKLTSDVPVFASYNMKGAEDHNKKLLNKWSKINPHLPEA